MGGVNVRAKFHCTSVTIFSHGAKAYTFSAAMGEDNKTWAKYTPAGSLNITIDNQAAQQFEPGKHYFLDFSEAP